MGIGMGPLAGVGMQVASICLEKRSLVDWESGHTQFVVGIFTHFFGQLAGPTCGGALAVQSDIASEWGIAENRKSINMWGHSPELLGIGWMVLLGGGTSTTNPQAQKRVKGQGEGATAAQEGPQTGGRTNVRDGYPTQSGPSAPVMYDTTVCSNRPRLTQPAQNSRSGGMYLKKKKKKEGQKT